jgi:hypothetical protein
MTGIGIVIRKYCRNSVQVCNNQLLCTKALRALIYLRYMILMQLVVTNDVIETAHVKRGLLCYELQHATQLQSSDTFSHRHVSMTRMSDMWLLKFVLAIRCFVQT